MFYILFTLIVGLSFSPLIFKWLHIWHAQGLWVQICLLLAFSYSFFERPKQVPLNKSLGILHVWVAGLTLFMCYFLQNRGISNATMFFPYFNFLCLIILYKMVTEYLDEGHIKRILYAFRYVVIVTMIVSTLQVFDLSQFFKLIHPDNKWHNNIVTGFLGNGTHLSGFLASTTPLFLKRSRENVLCLILMFLVLFFTGTTRGDPSISGFVVMFSIICLWNGVRGCLIGGVLGLIISVVLVKTSPGNFLGDNGRFGLWSYYFGIFKDFYPITGMGLGKINRVYQASAYPDTRHLHLEYFQFMFELGIIGLILIGNLIKSFIQRPSGETVKILKFCIYGFLISCLFNYPAHLWLPSTFAMFCYASVFAIQRRLNV